MLKKVLFVYVFLFSYSGAMLHSIMPHHHHNSYREAKAHHHYNHQTSHSHSDEHKDNNNRDSDSPHLLTHVSNTDVLVDHASGEGAANGKKAEKLIAVYTALPVFSFVRSQQIFHPPSDDLITQSSLYLLSALRAPPFPIV